jgi:hypothetical protein
MMLVGSLFVFSVGYTGSLRTASNYLSFETHIYEVKVKVKCTLVQALRLCTGRTAHTGSRGIALLYRH